MSNEQAISIHKRLAGRERRLRSCPEALAALFERLGGAEQARLVMLWKNWDDVMGPLAELGCPLGHKDDALLVGADDAMAMQELSLLSIELLERANAFMGNDFFQQLKVHLRQGQRDLAQTRPLPTARPSSPVPPGAFPRLGRLTGQLDPASPVTRCYEAHVAASRRDPST